MIAEAIKAVTDFAVKAATPAKIDSGDPETLAYVINGEVVKLTAEPPPRAHHAGSLDDLIALANRFSYDTSGFYRPVVWYDANQVVLVIDDENEEGDAHRLGRVTLTLETSDVFARLVKLRDNPAAAWMEQKPFERLLRVDLAGTLDNFALLNQVRKITWTNSSKVAGNVGRQAESFGREITSKADTDGKDLPEAVKLMVPVYKTAGERERYAVNCTVEIEPAEAKLQLLPMPDEIERVRQLAVASIGERLAAGLVNVPAYYGRP